MQLNLDFEICALVIMIVILCLQKFEQCAIVTRSRIFLAMTITQILTIVLNIVSRTVLFYGGEAVFSWDRYLVIGFYACQYLVVILTMAYMVTLVGRDINRRGISLIHFYLPVVIYIEEIVRCVIVNHLFTYDSQYGLLETSQVNVLNAIAVYCVLYGLLYNIRFAWFNSYGKLTFIAIITVFVGIAALIQGKIPDAMFIDFVISIAMMMVYFVAQDPGQMLDNNTQVLNRSMMDEMMRADIYNDKSFDLLVLALDEFKFVNKSYGVAVGDMMLIQVAQFLRDLEGNTAVFRYSSDQFAVKCPHSPEQTRRYLDQIAERFRHPWIVEGVSLMLSTTVAVVTWPDDGGEFEEIIDVIDYSILSSKKSGKGNVVYARDVDLQSLRKEKAIEKALNKAIEEDTIEVHYQPIFNTEKGCYTSAEALVRIRDDELGNLSPEVFIPIAESNGSIIPMGEMIFEKVCRFISENNLRDSSIEYIEINVSVVQCMQTDFVDKLNEIMERYGVTPDQINLEVTETAAINSVSVLQENIDRLHAQGISFALDDYGSGYATIGYIHQLPFNIIKLDKLMVWDAFESNRADITLRYTVGMLKELEVHIVAEGVETQEQQKRLEDIGCDYLQGWYYSKAMRPEEFLELIKQSA